MKRTPTGGVPAILIALFSALAACGVDDNTAPSGQSGSGGGNGGTSGSGTSAGGTVGVTGSGGSGGLVGNAGSGGSAGASGTAGLGGSAGSEGIGGSGGSAGSGGSIDAGQPHIYSATCSLPTVDGGTSEGGADGGGLEGGATDAAGDATAAAGPPLASFTLYDYETNLPFSGCKEFVKDFVVTITGDNVPLTLVANIAPGTTPGRIIFDQDGNLGVDIERRSPFALGGDSVENDFDAPIHPLDPGVHTITITAYAEVDPPGDAGDGGDGGLGTVLGSSTIKITIIKK